MSAGSSTRFRKGQSGNPAGRPKARRPHISAFDIIFDKTLTVTQNGVVRDLTVDEALQIQTYQAALKGSRMAVRAVLKMIEKREVALAKLNPPRSTKARLECEHDSDNAHAALLLLGIAEDGSTTTSEHHRPGWIKVATWAAQLGISLSGRRRLSDKDVQDINRLTHQSDRLRWPRKRSV